jgi:multidrug efflux pump subunit AcrA (membrane-fusion protein)
MAGSGAAVVVGRLTDAAWSSLHAERTTEAVGQLARERRERYAELAGVKREQAALAGSVVDDDGSVWPSQLWRRSSIVRVSCRPVGEWGSGQIRP